MSTFAKAVAVDALAVKHLLRPNARLANAVTHSSARGLPPIAISPLQGKFLALQCRMLGAKNVLEIGTLGGYSTIWFAEAGAKVTSLEIDPKHRDVALENTKGLDVDVILGPALDSLPKLAQQGNKFDMVFIDADWEQQWEYFDWAVKLLSDRGCIYVDNVIRELLEADAVKEGVESLITKVGRDERVSATLVPLASGHRGSEGISYDGFLIATRV